MKFTQNVQFCAFFIPVILLCGECMFRDDPGSVAVTAILSIIAIQLMSVIERHVVDEAV